MCVSEIETARPAARSAGLPVRRTSGAPPVSTTSTSRKPHPPRPSALTTASFAQKRAARCSPGCACPEAYPTRRREQTLREPRLPLERALEPLDLQQVDADSGHGPSVTGLFDEKPEALVALDESKRVVEAVRVAPTRIAHELDERATPLASALDRIEHQLAADPAAAMIGANPHGLHMGPIPPVATEPGDVRDLEVCNDLSSSSPTTISFLGSASIAAKAARYCASTAPGMGRVDSSSTRSATTAGRSSRRALRNSTSYSTVTVFARFRGLSTFSPRAVAM